MGLVCTNVIDGIPDDCREGNSYLQMDRLFVTTRDFEFATYAAASAKTNWDAGILAKSIFTSLLIDEVEDLTVEKEIYESSSGRLKKLKNLKRRFKVSFDMTLDQHKVITQWGGKKLNVFWSDENSNITGTSPDGIRVKGFKISFIDVDGLPVPVAGIPLYTKVDIQLERAKELDVEGLTINPSEGTLATRWTPSDLSTMTRVTVTQVGTIAANVAVFNVAYKSVSDINNDGNPVTDAAVEGLVIANTAFTDGSSPVVPLTVVESLTIPGEYTATFSPTFTAGTVEILPSSTQLFESNVTALV